MKYDLSVVAPCYNESQNVTELVERLLRVFEKKRIAGEIVLVDDGSSDNTGEVIRRLAIQHPHVSAFHHDRNRGIAEGWKTGVAGARGTYVCLIDADLQNLPEDVWRLYREIGNSHADVVQGTRSAIGNSKDVRWVMSKGLNFLLNTCFGMHLRDNKSGFVIALKDVMEDCLRHRFDYCYFQAFIMVSAAARGYSIGQVDTLFESRLLGKSFMSALPVAVIAKCLVDIVKAVFEFRILFKKPDVVTQFLAANPPTRSDPRPALWRRLWQGLFFLTMPLHKWTITRRARSYYRDLRQSQWLPLERIRALQELKLRRLVRQAYYHVAYYRERMDQAGVKPSDIRTLDDLARLPLLSKDDVRDNVYLDLLSDNHDKRRILKITTSGSTGEPFVCYADDSQLEIRWAATQRSMEWTGWRFGDRQARLWHQTIGMSWSQIVRERIDALFNRRLFIPAFEMSDENIARMVEALRRHDPVLIDGYAESLNFLAHYLRGNPALGGLRPLGIISSAQMLPDESREIIEKTFGASVYDKYGSREFSGIAWECEKHQGHHVVAESYIVEVLKDGAPAKPGELGEVVITDLNNFCMPLIRYRIGDLAVAMDDGERCPCGRGLPRIGRIEGRVQAMILGGANRYLPSSFFLHVFKDFDFAVRQFQVRQQKPGKVQLKVVKAARFDDAQFGILIDRLRRHMGEETELEVEFVDRIPMGRTGKVQVSTSELKIDFQELDGRRVVVTGLEGAADGSTPEPAYSLRAGR